VGRGIVIRDFFVESQLGRKQIGRSLTSLASLSHCCQDGFSSRRQVHPVGCVDSENERVSGFEFLESTVQLLLLICANFQQIPSNAMNTEPPATLGMIAVRKIRKNET
jgi:hypothetical protein